MNKACKLQETKKKKLQFFSLENNQNNYGYNSINDDEKSIIF